MIAKIGTKEVNIKHHGQERIHETTIQWIEADDTKLLQCLSWVECWISWSSHKN